MTATMIMAVIGGTVVVLTAAARIPAALTELLRACIPVAAAIHELRAALSGHPPHDDSAPSEDPAPAPARPWPSR
jgi:hypothetical protein